MQSKTYGQKNFFKMSAKMVCNDIRVNDDKFYWVNYPLNS